MYKYDVEVVWGQDSVIANRCLNDTACTVAYAAEVRAARDLIDDPALVDEAERIHAMIWPLIQSDPRREYVYDGAPYVSDADFYGAYEWVVGWLADRPAQLDAILAERGF